MSEAALVKQQVRDPVELRENSHEYIRWKPGWALICRLCGVVHRQETRHLVCRGMVIVELVETKGGMQ